MIGLCGSRRAIFWIALALARILSLLEALSACSEDVERVFRSGRAHKRWLQALSRGRSASIKRELEQVARGEKPGGTIGAAIGAEGQGNHRKANRAARRKLRRLEIKLALILLAQISLPRTSQRAGLRKFRFGTPPAAEPRPNLCRDRIRAETQFAQCARRPRHLVKTEVQRLDFGGRVARHFHADADFNDDRSRPSHF